MNYDELEPHLSAPRLHKYFAIYNDKNRAVALYKANLSLSQSFHPLLGVFEVALRNNVYAAIASHFGDDDWIINQKDGFMADESLAGTRYYLRRSIIKTEDRLTDREIPITSGNVVAEQYLSFWTELFEPHYYGLLAATPINAFPLRPSNFSRWDIAGRLQTIRKWRNRINHNEPICLFQGRVDLRYPMRVRKTIRTMLSWMEPSLRDWTDSFDGVIAAAASCRSA